MTPHLRRRERFSLRPSFVRCPTPSGAHPARPVGATHPMTIQERLT
jgi:hypothetical protein